MRSERLIHGVRIVELSKGMGVTPSMISQWESGYRPIPVEREPQIEATIKRIAAPSGKLRR